MMYMKKFISTSSAILISGAMALSSVSAETESTDSQAPVPTLYNETTTGSIAGTGTVMVGNDRDSHGCIGSAGYNWNATSQKCTRPWEHQKQENKNERAQMQQEIKENKMKMMQENKADRQEFRQETKAKKRALSEKLHGQLIAVVEKLTQEKLTMVLANVDKVVAKIEASAISQAKKDNFLAQLEEIRTVVQDKLDALAGTGSGGNILSEVLSGVTLDTSSGSTAGTTGTTTGTGTASVTQ